MRDPASICEFITPKKQGIQLGLIIPKWLHTKHRQPCLTRGLREGGLIAQGSTSFQWLSNNSSVLKSFLSLAILHFSCIWHKMSSTVTEIYSCLQTLLLFALTESPWASLILSVTGQSTVVNIHAAKRYTKRDRAVHETPNSPIHIFPLLLVVPSLGLKREFTLLLLGSCLTRLPTGACQWWWFAFARGHLSNGNTVKSPAHFT